MTDILSKPSGARTRLGGAQALAAAAPAIFAPLAAMALSLDGAPVWSVALAVAGAAPLVMLAGSAVARPAPAWTFAAATAPLALVAAWFAWASGGPLSPAAPWAFAALLAAAVVGGPRAALTAALAAAALAIFMALGPEPPVRLLGFQPRAEREATAALSWAGAAAATAAAIWSALTSWASALPPLRHPTIAARRALSVLAEASEVCALRINGDGRIRQVLGAPERTLEIDREGLRGLTLAAITHPDDQDAVAALVAKALSNAATETQAEAPQPRLTIRMHSRLGGFRWIEAETWPSDALPPPPEPPRPDEAEAHASGGDTLLVLRARWRADLEVEGEADRDRSGFLAHIDAELRGEMKAVVGYAEILKNELFGPLGSERYRDYARRTHDAGARMLERVDELLDLAAIEAGRFAASAERIDPAPLVDGALRLIRARAERAGVALQAEVAPNTPHIVADRRALRRVLVNMALDAVGRGRMGDIAKLKVDAEQDAVRFQVIAVPRPSVVGAFPAGEPRAEPPNGADPAAAGFSDLAGPRSGGAESGAGGGARAAAVATQIGEARLGRMVANSLAERMGGSVIFSDPIDADQWPGAQGAGFARSVSGREAIYAEAILPIAPAVDAETDAAAAAALETARAQSEAEPAAAEAPRRRETVAEPDDADVPMFELEARAPAAKTADARPAEPSSVVARLFEPKQSTGADTAIVAAPLGDAAETPPSDRAAAKAPSTPPKLKTVALPGGAPAEGGEAGPQVRAPSAPTLAPPPATPAANSDRAAGDGPIAIPDLTPPQDNERPPPLALNRPGPKTDALAAALAAASAAATAPEEPGPAEDDLSIPEPTLDDEPGATPASAPEPDSTAEAEALAAEASSEPVAAAADAGEAPEAEAKPGDDVQSAGGGSDGERRAEDDPSEELRVAAVAPAEVAEPSEPNGGAKPKG